MERIIEFTISYTYTCLLYLLDEENILTVFHEKNLINLTSKMSCCVYETDCLRCFDWLRNQRNYHLILTVILYQKEPLKNYQNINIYGSQFHRS